ncbi:MAG TPA: hypothetical protein VE621_24100 [Bryobacteraceae bacterium]|nr:hypothetical protein [Bryobacteraceae bacterium]
MPRTDMYFKVTVDHEEDESLDKLATEISRQLEKIYVVRRAELSNYVTQGKLPSEEED